LSLPFLSSAHAMAAEQTSLPTGATEQKAQGCFWQWCLLPEKQALSAEVGREIVLTPDNSPTEEEGSGISKEEASGSGVSLRKGLSSCSTAVQSTVTDKTTVNNDGSKDASILREGQMLALPKIMSNAAMMAIKTSPRSSQAVTTPSNTPLMRKRDALKKATRHLTERMTRKFTLFYRSKSSVSTAGRRLPVPTKPTMQPLSTHEIQASLSDLRAALMKVKRCPMIQFLKQVGGCHHFTTTDWEDGREHPGTKVRRCSYTTPVPADVPAFARRLLSVPDEINTSTVWQLSGDEKEMLLQQHSCSPDIMYGDRFKVQNVLHFCELREGVVTAKQWVDIVWEKPLPWTHGVVRQFIETKTKKDGLTFSGDLVSMLQEAASQCHEEEEDGRSMPPSSKPASLLAEADGS